MLNREIGQEIEAGFAAWFYWMYWIGSGRGREVKIGVCAIVHSLDMSIESRD